MKLSSEELIKSCQAIHRKFLNDGNWKPEDKEYLNSLTRKAFPTFANESDDNLRQAFRALESYIRDEAVNLIAVMNSSVEDNVKTINIPRSHINDFMSHRGWWALMDNPHLEPGQLIKFQLSDVKSVLARVVTCGLDNTGEIPKSFVNWWIIRYEEVK